MLRRFFATPLPAQTALRALAGFAARADGGSSGAEAPARAAARAHLDLLEATRKEFTRARALLVAQRQALAARDELDMANSSFRLRAQHEVPRTGQADPVPDHWRNSVLFEWQVPELTKQFVMDKARPDGSSTRLDSYLLRN